MSVQMLESPLKHHISSITVPSSLLVTWFTLQPARLFARRVRVLYVSTNGCSTRDTVSYILTIIIMSPQPQNSLYPSLEPLLNHLVRRSVRSHIFTHCLLLYCNSPERTESPCWPLFPHGLLPPVDFSLRIRMIVSGKLYNGRHTVSPEPSRTL